MKTCLICHAVAENGAPTCAECGEASWDDAAPSPVPVDDAPADSPAPVPSRRPRAKS